MRFFDDRCAVAPGKNGGKMVGAALSEVDGMPNVAADVVHEPSQVLALFLFHYLVIARPLEKIFRCLRKSKIWLRLVSTFN